MDRRDIVHDTLESQLAQFEVEHPEVSEAMRLFGMTMTEYQGVLHVLNDPHIYRSDSTGPMSRPDSKRLVNNG